MSGFSPALHNDRLSSAAVWIIPSKSARFMSATRGSAVSAVHRNVDGGWTHRLYTATSAGWLPPSNGMALNCTVPGGTASPDTLPVSARGNGIFYTGHIPVS